MGLFEHFPYVNFHNLNLDWILQKIKELLTRMTAAEEKLEEHEARLDAAEETLQDHEERLTAAEADIDDLQDRMTAAEGDIDDLQDRMTAAEGDIDDLQDRMTSAEGDIDDLQGRMTAVEGELDDLLDVTYLIRYDFADLTTNVQVTGDVSYSTSANWARVNPDKSVDFSIDVGYTADTYDPSSITATVTLDLTKLGSTIKDLYYLYPMYAQSIALGSDPGIVGAASLNPSTHSIQFVVEDDQDVNITGRFFLN